MIDFLFPFIVFVYVLSIIFSIGVLFAILFMFLFLIDEIFFNNQLYTYIKNKLKQITLKQKKGDRNGRK